MSEYFDYSSGRLPAAGTARSRDVNAIFDAIDTGLARLPSSDRMKRGTLRFAVDTGTADAYLVELPSTPAEYHDGLEVVMRPINTNTGAATINVDSLGVRAITRQDGAALMAGDITIGRIVTLRYSTVHGEFQIQGSTAQGAGTMAEQNASAVSITGGTVDGVNIIPTAAAIPDRIPKYDAIGLLALGVGNPGWTVVDPNTLADLETTQFFTHDDTDTPSDSPVAAEHAVGIHIAAGDTAGEYDIQVWIGLDSSRVFTRRRTAGAFEDWAELYTTENIHASASAPTSGDGNDGDLWLQYEGA